MRTSPMLKALALALAVGTANFAAAQDVKATLDSSVVELASQAKLTISATVPTGTKVTPPKFTNNQIIPTLEVVSEQKPDTIISVNQSVTYQFHYMITSFEDSAYTIPPIALLAGKDTLRTPPIDITFTLLQGVDSTFLSTLDTTKQIVKIFDIKDIKDTPWTFAEFWGRFGGLIIILLIVALVASAITYVIIRIVRNKPIIPIIKPKEPAEKVALRNLDNLKARKLWEDGFVKEYYTELTEIVKTYISNRFGTSVMESTSQETLVILEKFVSKKSEAYEGMEEIFSVADFVKFAKLTPQPDSNEKCLKLAYTIVETTCPKPEEQQDATGQVANNKKAQSIKTK